MANYYRPSSAKLWFFAFILLFLLGIMGQMTRRMYRDQDAGGFSQARGAERLKARKDLEAAAAIELTKPGWVDQSKGVVRIPIEQSKELVIKQWGENPAVARSNLIARSQQAAAPPPKVREKPSQFE
jgi:hypothetical protein